MNDNSIFTKIEHDELAYMELMSEGFDKNWRTQRQELAAVLGVDESTITAKIKEDGSIHIQVEKLSTSNRIDKVSQNEYSQKSYSQDNKGEYLSGATHSDWLTGGYYEPS